MNKVILTNSFLGKKGVELKFTPGKGTPVATYSVAVKKDYSNSDKTEYDYFNCVTWNKPAEFLANNQDRIKKVGIIGRLQTRNYEAKDGHKVYVTEVITESVEVEQWAEEGTNSGTNNYSGGVTQENYEEGDIPF